MTRGLAAALAVASVALSAPARAQDPAAAAIDPEAACRELLLAQDVVGADSCYRALALDRSAPRDVRERASATLELLDAWAAGGRATLEPALAPPDSAEETVSVSALVADSVKQGLAEGVLASAVLGAVGVTTATSALLAKNRTDRLTSTPLLLLAPALGGVAGAAAGYALIDALEPSPGDVALATSASTLGFVAAFPLQLLIFKDSSAVSDVPLRFLTVLGGGAVGALVGGVGAAFLDVSQGDVALAHSASLWSTVMMAFVLSYRQGDVEDLVLPFEAALLVPYAVVIGAHRFIEINRFATWLIEGGGVSGLLLAGAVAIATQPGDVRPLFMTGTALGVGAGLVAAFFADDFLDHAEDAAPEEGR